MDTGWWERPPFYIVSCCKTLVGFRLECIPEGVYSTLGSCKVCGVAKRIYGQEGNLYFRKTYSLANCINFTTPSSFSERG